MAARCANDGVRVALPRRPREFDERAPKIAAIDFVGREPAMNSLATTSS
jgi:hypothetical protein